MKDRSIRKSKLVRSLVALLVLEQMIERCPLGEGLAGHLHTHRLGGRNCLFHENQSVHTYLFIYYIEKPLILDCLAACADAADMVTQG